MWVIEKFTKVKKRRHWPGSKKKEKKKKQVADLSVCYIMFKIQMFYLFCK